MERKNVPKDKPRMARSSVMIGKDSHVALTMISESDKAASESEPPPSVLPTVTFSSALPKKPPPLPPKLNTDEEKPPPTPNEGKPKRKGRVRTFRIWAPQQDKKGILVKVGHEEEEEEAEKIFESTQIRHKSFREWHKEARSQLPSVTGGPPLENVADLINMAPTLKKEEDPRVLQKTIRRLSIESDKDIPAPVQERRKSSVPVDYTKLREVKVVPLEKVEEEEEEQNNDEDEEEDNDSDDEETDVGELEEESSEDVIIDVSSDEEERQLEKERKQAGKDIKDKIKTLRDLADHLSSKREVRHSLVQKATGLVVLDTEQIPLKEHLLYLIEDCTSAIYDFVDKLVIWKKPISEINGRYGVVTASYFIWLRQMIALELFFFIITNIMIIIPQVVEDMIDPVDYQNRAHFSLSDLINGEGYLHHTYLYYTGYHSRNEGAENPLYNPAFRFIMCMLFIFFVLTYFIFSRLTKYYQSIRMESKVAGVAHMEHFKAIICGWDFGCQDPQAKVYLHKSIKRELYILARSSDEKYNKVRGSVVINMEMKNKKILAFAVKHLGVFYGPWAIYIFGNFLLLIACFVLGVILVELCQLKLRYYIECVALRDDQIQRKLNDQYLCPQGSQKLNTTILSLPALFASITTLLLTKLILIVGDNEVYNSPERKIYATMFRAGFFYFTNIGVFYSFWILQKPLLKKEGFVAETIFGKELYRLVVIQGVIDVMLNFAGKGMYHLIRKRRKDYVMTEFRTEYCSLSMFFIHSVSRIGTLFCPPLGIFVTVRLVLDFYQNRFALLHLSAKETYSTHASHVYAPFLLTFFILCYLITSCMNVYYINSTTPSVYNGPFAKYNESYDQVLGLLLRNDSGVSWLTSLATPGFLVTFNAILCGLLYFCRYWGHTYEPIIEHLNDLIGQERADRDLLLVAIFEIGQVTAETLVGDSKKIKKSKLFEAVKTIVPSKLDDSPDEQEAVKKPVVEGAEKDKSGKVEAGPSPTAVKPSPAAPPPTVIQITGPPPPTTTVPPSVATPRPGNTVTFSGIAPPQPSTVQKSGPGPPAPPPLGAPAPSGGSTTEEVQTIEEQIRAVIYQVKTRRRAQEQPQKRLSIPMRTVDKKEVEERQKAALAQEEKALKNANQNMNSVLGNLIQKRKNMMMMKVSTPTRQPSSPAVATQQLTTTANQQKTQKGSQPPKLQQQIKDLSVMKLGEVSSYANTAKKRVSIHSTKVNSAKPGAGKKS